MGEPDKKSSLEPTATTRNRTQLLLHCVDGCVPYLNPYQLEQHFPASETDLWLGLAVRDTCVAPIFNSPSVSGKSRGGGNKRKMKKKEPDSTKNKVHGYTFAATPPDPWLLPYTRLTVPSFDLRSIEKCDAGPKSVIKGISCGNTSKNTNNSVHVWTPHGRQKLTADLYATVSLEGLKSQHTISLFDDVDEEHFSKRRKRKAEDRNEQWFQHISARHDSIFLKEPSTNGANNVTMACVRGDSCSLLWKPILLPHQVEKSDFEDEITNHSTSCLKADVKEGNNTKYIPSGIAFVGRWRPGLQLDKLVHKDSITNTHFDLVQWKAILTTYSLSEILEIAKIGMVNVIGTNLPQKWAKEKHALGLDLSIEPLLDIPAVGRRAKRQKTTSIETKSSSKANVTIADKVLLNADGCMDLSDKAYARDPRRLVAGCECFVCKENRFSRAYIHHLVVAKEMLAEILIFGHNLHCLLKLLQCFNSESNRNKVNDFILHQLPS